MKMAFKRSYQLKMKKSKSYFFCKQEKNPETSILDVTLKVKQSHNGNRKGHENATNESFFQEMTNKLIHILNIERKKRK